jgi:hypothetical protein
MLDIYATWEIGADCEMFEVWHGPFCVQRAYITAFSERVEHFHWNQEAR